MEDGTIAVVDRVLQKSGREHPADAVLRTELKNQSRLSKYQSAEVSWTVFAYYRWFGWLDRNRSLSEQLNVAAELANRMRKTPASFSDAELIEHAVQRWVKEQLDITPEWVRSLQQEPRLWLRAKPGEGREVARKLNDCRIFGDGVLADTLEYLGRQDLFRTPEFHNGDFEVQDISSQAVGLLCDPKPGESWWDACAGEGGKTMHLSALMQNKGLIWVSDRAEWRLEKLKRRAARARVFNYRLKPWDGGPKLPTRTKFDGVLVDAPCSGIGTWQRNPHAKWTTEAADVAELSAIQKRLLSHVAGAVKPGGKLVYAVCSLAHPETVEVAQAFEQQHPEFARMPLLNPLSKQSEPTQHLRLWPQDFGGNGMFVAAWKRAA